MAIKTQIASLTAVVAMAFSSCVNAEKQDFQGTWLGTLSGLSVQVMIWTYGNTNEVEDTNAVIWVNNQVEALPVPG